MKLVKEKLDESDIGKWELTEVTAAGTVTRTNKSITGEGIIYHDDDDGNKKMVKETLNQNSSFEDVIDKKSLVNRRKELKSQGYYIEDSKISKGFTAKKDNKRIVVRIK